MSPLHVKGHRLKNTSGVEGAVAGQGVDEFVAFVGLTRLEDFRQVTRAHVIAWRDALSAAEAAPATVRAKISALSSLFGYLTDKNAIKHNPVKGVKRPSEGSNEGKTPAISDHQARKLLRTVD